MKLFLNFEAVSFLTLWCMGSILLTSMHPQLSEAAENALNLGCTYTREYVTTLEFLRGHHDFGIPEMESRNIALKASQGCTGAAQRFIKVMSALSRSGVSGNDSLKAALEFSSKTDTETETFVSIFLKAFLTENLDLDLGSSLKLARSLSTEFQGDILAVKDDFEKIIQFCVSTQDLDLPKPECATLAAKVAHLGEKFSGGIGDPFIRTFLFLRSPRGPGLMIRPALQLAESLMEGGRDSADNFIQAYLYGVSKYGLKATTPEAIAFAKQMTFR